MPFRRAATLFALAFALTVAAPVAGQPRVPSADDILSIRRAGTPVISPDGSRVAYTVRETNWDDNAYETEIWLADTSGGQPRQLTRAKKSSSSPAWAPDGVRLGFISDREGKRQLYVIDTRGGDAEALTSAEDGIDAFEWSPDGTSIAYTQQDPETDAMKARGKRDGDYEVVGEESRPSHLHVLSVATRTPRRLTSGSFVVGAFAWSPDGGRIAFDHRRTANPEDGETADISLVTVADGTVRPIVTQAGPDSSPSWSPDGSTIAFETAMANPAHYYTNGLVATVSAHGGTITPISRGIDEDASLVAWTKDGVYVFALAGVWSRLYRVDPVSTRVTPLGSTLRTLDTGFTFSKDGTTVAFLRADAVSLGEIAVAPVATLDATLLTRQSEQLAPLRLGTRETIRWTSQDGTAIEGVLHKPDDFTPGRRYPLLIVIHGGPAAASRPIPLASSSVYPIDRWLARGALVLEPNYRGSAGYGERFRALNVRNLGVGDAWDVLSGIDHLVAQGLVDGSRVGAMGWSQGGYISAFLATHHASRFRAISVGAGISNWTTYYVSTDIAPFTRQYLKATPWDDPAIYALTSPMTAITRAKTPTLIQHGENDRRVPISNAYELQQGLLDRGVPVRFIVYKGFGHGLTKPRAARAAAEHNEAWFDRYFWNEGVAATGGTPREP